MRIRNSIKPLIIAKNEACYIMDCLCHNIHNAAHQGCPAFTSATHFEIGDFCVDRFYHFDNRTKRKCVLKIYYQFCDHEYTQILKNINVQCLRLERAVECILKQYAGLQSYFLSEDEPATGDNWAWGGRKRILRLKNAFKDPRTSVSVYQLQIYCYNVKTHGFI